jgi:hypothetical protein
MLSDCIDLSLTLDKSDMLLAAQHAPQQAHPCSFDVIGRRM